MGKDEGSVLGKEGARIEGKKKKEIVLSPRNFNSFFGVMQFQHFFLDKR